MLNKTVIAIGMIAVALVVTGCDRVYEGVPPNYIGMVLTPTGYENKIYTPGQVDIGETKMSGMGNSLVLIQRSGIGIKEAFIGPGASADQEDHRCLTGDRLPMTIDVRLLLAIPDYTTPQGKEDLQRLFLLGNPSQQSSRTLVLSAEQVYNDQAKQEVRSRIRSVCREYANFEAAFAATGAAGDANISRVVEKEVAQVFKMKGVPLGVVSVEVSNIKPDKSVTDALAHKAAVAEQQQAIQSMVDYLQGDPMRVFVYQTQMTREIAINAADKGGSLVLVTGGASTSNVIPIPGVPAHAKQVAQSTE